MPHGLQVFDDSGTLVLELGAHVVRESPVFAEKIGVISASWSQAEINLNCLFAVLLDVTPDEAAKKLKSWENNSAKKVTDNARKLAKERLLGAYLDSVMDILDQLDLVRLRRNRIQHDVWAKKGADNQKLFTVHADQYLAFSTQFFEALKKKDDEGTRTDALIRIAEQFAESIEFGYTIADLKEIELAIDQLSESLMSAISTCVYQRMKKL